MGSMGLSLVTLYTTGWKAKLVYALTCSVVLCGSAWYERLSRWHFENILERTLMLESLPSLP